MAQRAAPLALAAATGIFLVLLFPAANLAYFSPVALAPLLVALGDEPDWKWRFVLGWIAGIIYWGGTCYWIYYTMHVHGHVGAAGAAALLAGFMLVKGLHLGLFGCLAGPALRRFWAVPVVAAAWVAVEGTNQWSGFTWLMLGNAATNMSVVARLAPITGVAGMSFVLAMMNAAVALAIQRRPRAHLAWLLGLPLLYLLPSLPSSRLVPNTARLVQPNISEEELSAASWTEQRQARLFSELSVLSSSRSPAADPPDLIVWPENPAPLYYYNDPVFRRFAEDIARDQSASLLFGTVAFRAPDMREPLNSAVLIDSLGDEVARYDKIHLVPFGEFVPWPLNYLVEKVTKEAGDYVPGNRVVVARSGSHRIGTFICYESVFGSQVRQFVAGGAEVLVNISNDAWFGQSAARYQHLLIARMRAMENGRWLLRSTNTGVTAVIDPAGRVRGTLPIDRPGVLAAHFDFEDRLTLYTRWGDWFWWLAVAVTLAQAAGAAAGRLRRQS